MPFSQTMVSTDLSLWCFLTGLSYEKMKLVFVFKLFSDARRSRTSFTDYDRIVLTIFHKKCTPVNTGVHYLYPWC
jgi:hypothetical protein